MLSLKIARTFAGVLALAALAASLPAAVTPPGAREAAPGFELEDASGKRLGPGEYRGKVLLLNFWATWCHGCKQELPWFVEFEKKYKSRGLAVLGASTDSDGWKSVKPYLTRKPLNFPVVIADAGVAKAYGLAAMPMTVLIDRKGRVAATYVGVVDRAACEKDLQTLLREPSAP